MESAVGSGDSLRRLRAWRLVLPRSAAGFNWLLARLSRRQLVHGAGSVGTIAKARDRRPLPHAGRGRRQREHRGVGRRGNLVVLVLALRGARAFRSGPDPAGNSFVIPRSAESRDRAG